MPTPEARRARDRQFLRLGLANFIALIVVFALVVFLDYQGRERAWENDNKNCQISQAARIDLIRRERDIKGTAADLQEFALRAADARRAAGDPTVARAYEQIANRAVSRADNSAGRLERAQERTRTAACRVIYPKPSLNPLGGLGAHR